MLKVLDEFYLKGGVFYGFIQFIFSSENAIVFRGE